MQSENQTVVQKLSFKRISGLVGVLAVVVVLGIVASRAGKPQAVQTLHFSEKQLASAVVERLPAYADIRVDRHESSLVTLGQWYTLAGVGVPATSSVDRGSPVYVWKGYGRFVPGALSTEPAHDRLIVAIDANTLQLIGFESYPPGVPEMNIDVTVADRRWTFAAMTAVPRDEGDPTAMPFPPVIHTPAADVLPVPAGP